MIIMDDGNELKAKKSQRQKKNKKQKEFKREREGKEKTEREVEEAGGRHREGWTYGKKDT